MSDNAPSNYLVMSGTKCFEQSSLWIAHLFDRLRQGVQDIGGCRRECVQARFTVWVEAQIMMLHVMLCQHASTL